MNAKVRLVQHYYHLLLINFRSSRSSDTISSISMCWFLCWYLNFVISSSSSSILSFFGRCVSDDASRAPLERLFVKIFTCIFSHSIREQWSAFTSFLEPINLLCGSGQSLIPDFKNNHLVWLIMISCAAQSRVDHNEQWTMNNEHNLRIVCRRSALDNTSFSIEATVLPHCTWLL